MSSKQKKITDSYSEKKQRSASTTVKARRKITFDENFDESSIEELFVDDSKGSAENRGEEEVDPFYLAKRALHISTPRNLPCRESQIQQVHEFTTKHLGSGSSGSLYISGAPGTGKTAVVTHVLERLETRGHEAFKFVKVFVNCLNLRKPGVVLEDIAQQLKIRQNTEVPLKDSLLKRITSKSSKHVVLVLDEMDQLLAKSTKELLYTLFEWTRLPKARLILIGIANALDLTVRHMPDFFSSPKSSPSSSKTRNSRGAKDLISQTQSEVMSFPPYDRDDIALILEDRLKGVASTGSQVFDPAAIKFVALKVAATTGDMRKALSACKLAIQSLETKANGLRSPLKRTADDGFNSSSPKKQCLPASDKIGVACVAKVLCPEKLDDLPQQQAVILATLLRIYRKAPKTSTKSLVVDGVVSPIPFDTIYSEHHKVCKLGCFSRIESSDVPSYCAQLQDRSILTIVENSGSGGRKKFVKTNKSTGVIFDPEAAERALRTNPHLKAILDC